MFYRFSKRALKIMSLAKQEAKRFNHNIIDTEHMLFGLIEEGSGVGVAALKALGVDLVKLRQETDKKIRFGSEMIDGAKPLQSPASCRVIEYAIEEGKMMDDNYVGSEHILLGLLRETKGAAAQILSDAGLKLEGIRRKIPDVRL